MRGLEEFLSWLSVEKNYSRHTIQAYRRDLEQFQTYCSNVFEVEEPLEAGKNEIKSWIMELMDHSYSPSSVNRKLVSLSSFYNYQLREGVVQLNPVTQVHRPKKARRLAGFVEEDLISRVLNPSNFPSDFKGLRDRLALELLYGTGVRIAELLSVSKADFDFQRGNLKVLGKGNKERYIPVSKGLRELVTEYSKAASEEGINITEKGVLLKADSGRPLYPMFLHRMLKRRLGEFSNMSKTNAHLLRHSFATHLLNNGSDIQAIKELLGHSSLSSTSVYTHNSIERLREVHKKSHPRK